MTELTIFNNLKEAYETSTHNFNRFEKAISSIAWDEKFEADGEFYFCLGAFTFTTPSLDPFKITRNWVPSAIFSDGSSIYF